MIGSLRRRVVFLSEPSINVDDARFLDNVVGITLSNIPVGLYLRSLLSFFFHPLTLLLFSSFHIQLALTWSHRPALIHSKLSHTICPALDLLILTITVLSNIYDTPVPVSIQKQQQHNTLPGRHDQW